MLEPGPELWHALDVYQLGALLHDLIMREPMFRKEKEESETNRYRFAWLVATITPEVSAVDVDADLILLARRALDKDYKRRSALSLRDFLLDRRVVERNSLAIIGLAPRVELPNDNPPRSSLKTKLLEIVSNLNIRISDHLLAQGITCEHSVTIGGGDMRKKVKFTWEVPPAAASALATKVLFELDTQIYVDMIGKVLIGVTGILKVDLEGRSHASQIDFPPIPYSDAAEGEILEQAMTSLPALSAMLASQKTQGVHD